MTNRCALHDVISIYIYIYRYHRPSLTWLCFSKICGYMWCGMTLNRNPDVWEMSDLSIDYFQFCGKTAVGPEILSRELVGFTGGCIHFFSHLGGQWFYTSSDSSRMSWCSSRRHWGAPNCARLQANKVLSSQCDSLWKSLCWVYRSCLSQQKRSSFFGKELCICIGEQLDLARLR